jgi:leucyl aminopeptidase
MAAMKQSSLQPARFADLLQPDRGQRAMTVHLTDKSGFDEWLTAQSERVRSAVVAQSFKGEAFQLAILPGERDDWSAVLGVAKRDSLGEWCVAKAAETLPEGTYRLADGSPGPAALGWLLGQYRFDRFKKEPKAKNARVLLSAEPARIDEAVTSRSPSPAAPGSPRNIRWSTRSARRQPGSARRG